MKKSIFGTVSFLIGVVAGGSAIGKYLNEKLTEKQEMSDKHLDLFLMMNQWVRNRQEGKELSLYFERNGYRKIAVYGVSYVGQTLLNELKDTTIHVNYAVDRNSGKKVDGVMVYSVEEMTDNVDAIVVTAIGAFDEIRDMLEEIVNCPIISLEDIIFEV
ncbi:hypothetical protein NSB25_00270 [Acetatifactor muris]|uniref:CoA-binding domain-containing protein n=1 Tax=Acetatifactor muris TaxID=879566 RepID=A0A2K4ZG71_9FIRM|nr:hypothetical protein [Acetatifactor muris]MCR2045721.1 hypothetical protein [Acetatifactor muris]SOY29459.1 hypothetical protein AMURIS_02180 [Acetatifactor muris]